MYSGILSDRRRFVLGLAPVCDRAASWFRHISASAA